MGPWGCLYVGGNEEHQRSVEQWREKGYTAWIRGDAGTNMYQDRPRIPMNPSRSPGLTHMPSSQHPYDSVQLRGPWDGSLTQEGALCIECTHREESTRSWRRMVRWTMVACGARDANDGASFPHPSAREGNTLVSSSSLHSLQWPSSSSIQKVPATRKPLILFSSPCPHE